MKKIKVLQLHPDYNVKAHDFADLAEQIIIALPSTEYEVTSAYLRGRPGEGDPVSKAAHSHYFEFTDGELSGLRLKALWRLYRLCRAERFDVVICNRFKPLSMMLLLNRWLKVPLCIGIIHRMGEFDRYYRRRQVGKLGQTGWRFIGVSEAVRQHLLDYQCGFGEHNTFAITNAIDIEQAVGLQLSRDEARQQLGLDHSAILLGALGRLVPVKGHRYLIDAFNRLKDKYPQAQLAIIGEGKERSALQKQIAACELQGRVHLLGFRPDALQYARAFDIWVMPSLAEGLGLALLEGMSGALPVIASDVPAMRPLIAGAGGIAVPPADVDALTAALDSYLGASAAERQRLGQQAFEYLCREHSIGEYRQAYLGLIRQGLGLEART